MKVISKGGFWGETTIAQVGLVGGEKVATHRRDGRTWLPTQLLARQRCFRNSQALAREPFPFARQDPLGWKAPEAGWEQGSGSAGFRGFPAERRLVHVIEDDKRSNSRRRGVRQPWP